MKKLAYLLMTLMLLSSLSMGAQTYGKPYRPQHARQNSVYETTQQLPNVTMRSTSTFYSSGSALPQAAVTGTYTADEISNPARLGGTKRVGGSGWADDDDDNPDDKDDDTPKDPGEPDPLGDAMLPLMLLACIYAVMALRRRKRVEM